MVRKQTGTCAGQNNKETPKGAHCRSSPMPSDAAWHSPGSESRQRLTGGFAP